MNFILQNSNRWNREHDRLIDFNSRYRRVLFSSRLFGSNLLWRNFLYRWFCRACCFFDWRFLFHSDILFGRWFFGGFYLRPCKIYLFFGWHTFLPRQVSPREKRTL